MTVIEAGNLIERLLNSQQACIRYQTRTKLLGEGGSSSSGEGERDSDRELQALAQEVRSSPLVEGLLSQSADYAPPPSHPYSKWYGAHWILASLANIGYPAGDERLLPWRDQVLDWLLPDGVFRQRPLIAGLVRRCASQEGNALYYLIALGLDDERVDRLAHGLLEWQWPDGGWNCDRKLKASNSSFHETLLPMRGLAWYAKSRDDKATARAVEHAADVFLKRDMFRRQSDGQVINPKFIQIHYPPYWHYDILCGLKVMAEAGLVRDARCNQALDLLEQKQLPEGGWMAEGKYYRLLPSLKSQRELVEWGAVGRKRLNEFVSVDALWVLIEAGRW
jgi:hypothetical protein